MITDDSANRENFMRVVNLTTRYWRVVHSWPSIMWVVRLPWRKGVERDSIHWGDSFKAVLYMAERQSPHLWFREGHFRWIYMTLFTPPVIHWSPLKLVCMSLWSRGLSPVNADEQLNPVPRCCLFRHPPASSLSDSSPPSCIRCDRGGHGDHEQQPPPASAGLCVRDRPHPPAVGAAGTTGARRGVQRCHLRRGGEALSGTPGHPGCSLPLFQVNSRLTDGSLCCWWCVKGSVVAKTKTLPRLGRIEVSTRLR